MIIKTQLHEAQDDLAANKAFATKLLHDLDREGISTQYVIIMM